MVRRSHRSSSNPLFLEADAVPAASLMIAAIMDEHDRHHARNNAGGSGSRGYRSPSPVRRSLLALTSPLRHHHIPRHPDLLHGASSSRLPAELDQQPAGTLSSTTTTTTTMAASSPPVTPKRRRKLLLKHLRGQRHKKKNSEQQQQQQLNGVVANGATTTASRSSSPTTTTTDGPNVVQWLSSSSCPQDVVPVILAYAGPQKIAMMGRLNREWKRLMENDSTWRVLCEELYKWKPGVDGIPSTSWKEYYRLHPCVPVDFGSIQKALSVTVGEESALAQVQKQLQQQQQKRNSKKNKQQSSSSSSSSSSSGSSSSCSLDYQHVPLVSDVTVLIRPGEYHLQQAITIETIRRTTVVTLQRMDIGNNISNDTTDDDHKKTDTGTASNENDNLETSASRLMNSHLNLSRSGVDLILAGAAGVDYNDQHRNNSNIAFGRLPQDQPQERERERERETNVQLISRTRRRNEPLIRVFRGNLVCKNMQFKHHSLGIDIWNGNAAIQIQPPSTSTADDSMLLSPARPFAVPRASATVVQCEMTSESGRGIVTVEGGQLELRNSYIHDCAATGVYVGGRGSRASLRDSDVVYNGTGNMRAGGIARGHSGLYIEQGAVDIAHCNISNNSASGISVISRDFAVMKMQHTDVLGNGCSPLDMPVLRMMDHDQDRLFLQHHQHALIHNHINNNNNATLTLDREGNRIALMGTPKPRSAVLQRALERGEDDWDDSC